MYISTQINDANRPLHKEVITLVQQNNSALITRQEKDDAIDHHEDIL